MQTRARPTAGFTLVELFIVISIMSILASIVLPQFQPAVHDQLTGIARIVAADIEYARSVAVANNSTYQLTFDLPENRFVLRHTGINSLLDALPYTPFRSPADDADEQTTDLDELPHIGPQVALVAVHCQKALPESVSTLEFGPLGETTRPENTKIWLCCGAGRDLRYLPLEIDAVTGLVSAGDVQSAAPPAAGTP